MTPVGSIAVVTLASAVAAWLLTWAVRHYAIARDILDHPNQRSSHQRPTPRGGGIAIAIVLLVLIPILVVTDLLDRNIAVGVVGGGAMVAVVGWLDDLRGLSARTRALVHLLAAIWFIGWLYSDAIGVTQGGALYLLFSLIAIVWGINSYNFMDGIDGLAGIQAVVAGGFGALILFQHGQLGLSLVSLGIAAAALGFLTWNWSPARIFLGDVGSGLLGFCFAALAFASHRAGIPLIAWILLLGVFHGDALFTLARRLMAGERWYEAHKRHAYQRATQSGLTHGQVAAGSGALMLLLGGLAVVAATYAERATVCFAAGLALVVGQYLWVERRRPF